MTPLYRTEALKALKAKNTARGVILNHTAADARRNPPSNLLFIYKTSAYSRPLT